MQVIKAVPLAFVGLLVVGCAEDDNRAPSILPVEDIAIPVNTSGRINLAAADADDDSLSWSVTVEPEPPTQTAGEAGRPDVTRISSNQAVFTWTPGVADAGGQRAQDYDVTFRVSDGRGGRDNVTIRVTVTNEGVGGSGSLRFTEPLGAGMLVDLGQSPCITDMPVQVQGDLIANESVRVVLAEPRPERSTLSPDAPGKNKLFNWCPTEAQLDESRIWRLNFVATHDEGDAPVNKPFTVQFRQQAAAGCAGEAPVIEHDPPGRFRGPLNYEIRARIVDDLGFKSAPVLAFTTENVEGAEPSVSGWELVPFAPEDGDIWVAAVPNRGLMAGQTAEISYVIIATDNDDADGVRCDHETQSPVFRFTAEGGGGAGQTYGFCAPCASDEQCGTDADRCIDLQGEAFCGRSCEVADCRAGEQCLIVESVDGVSAAQCLPADLNCGQLCVDDPNEVGDRNDRPENASRIDPGSYENLTICGEDIDFFSVPVEAGQAIRATISFQHARGDLDLAMQLPGDMDFPYASNGYEDTESVFEACTAQAGAATIAVVGYQAPRNSYRLDVTREAGDCNVRCDDDAYDAEGGNDTLNDFFPVDTPFFQRGLLICPQDADYYGFDANAGQIIGVALGFDHADGDLDLKVYRSSGEEIGRSTGTLDGEVVEVIAPTDDIYVAHVYGATRSVVNAYDMEVQILELQQCERTQACPPGNYCGGGVCVEAQCARFDGCVDGHGCVPQRAGLDPSTSGGTCLDWCEGDGSCRAGEACKHFEDFSQRCGPAGAAGTGARCGGYQDCAGRRVCFPVPGGYCAAGGCGGDRPCGGDAVCGRLLGFDACLKRCGNDGDCRAAEGYRCQDVGGGQMGCAP